MFRVLGASSGEVPPSTCVIRTSVDAMTCVAEGRKKVWLHRNIARISGSALCKVQKGTSPSLQSAPRQNTTSGRQLASHQKHGPCQQRIAYTKQLRYARLEGRHASAVTPDLASSISIPMHSIEICIIAYLFLQHLDFNVPLFGNGCEV
jgi:hypothetical protein